MALRNASTRVVGGGRSLRAALAVAQLSLAVVLLSDSFLGIWEPLARAAGFAPPCATPLAANAGAAAVVIVAAGGAEDRAPDCVRELVTRGTGAAIVVVGAQDERRLAAAALAAGAAEYVALPAERDFRRPERAEIHRR